MSCNKILVFILTIYGMFSVSYSRSIHSLVKRDGRDYDTTSTTSTLLPSSAAPSESPSPFTWKGWLPIVITCAVLLHIFLPFVIWYIYRCLRQLFMNATKKEQLGTFNENIFEEGAGFKSILVMLSLYCYISFMLWMGYLICYEVLELHNLGYVFKALQIMSIVMMVLCGIYVLIESLISNEIHYLDNRMTKSQFEVYINKIKNTAPEVTFSVECYHYESRTKHTSNGSKTTLERIVTYKESKELPYGKWEDISSSDQVPDLKPLGIMRVEIRAFFEFGDDEIEEEYKDSKEQVKEENENRDRVMDFKVVKEIKDLEQRILVHNGVLEDVSWIAKQKFYWIATLLMLTWPYRWLFRAMTTKYCYDIKKKIYKSTIPPPQEGDMIDPCQSGSNINPSFVMSELPSNSGQISYPGLHSTNEDAPFIPANQHSPFSVAQNPSDFPPINQALAFPPINEPPFPLTNQDIPDIPPPLYDQAINSDYQNTDRS